MHCGGLVLKGYMQGACVGLRSNTSDWSFLRTRIPSPAGSTVVQWRFDTVHEEQGDGRGCGLGG